GNVLVINYTGTLYQSSDTVNWTGVAGATSPYKVTMGEKMIFFRTQGGVPIYQNMTIPLGDDVELDLIWIEPGTFIMGSPENEIGHIVGIYPYGETQHSETIQYGFWLGKYEVTHEQYKAIMGENPSEFTGGDKKPVENVNWYNAMSFCEKLTAREKEAGRLPAGYKYTLPTDVEWEYACRAGTTTAFNNGTNIPTEEQKYGEPCPNLDQVGWYWLNADGTVHTVGQKKPNAWGLYDMHGNVVEWTSSKALGVEGEAYIMRGGSWDHFAVDCRSASFIADKVDPNEKRGSYGFRVALSPITNNMDITIPLSNTVSLDMIWIKPGTFMMGSPENELGRSDDEVQHQVTLTKGYWLGKYEVTQAQYEAVTGSNPANFKGSNRPVENVNWFDAVNFCEKLTEIEKAAGRLPEGYEYTLPTEAQWEYACRAGTAAALNSGKNLSDESECSEMDEVGWYGYNSDNETHSVGQKMPNAWGLYDMHGNVWEWCLDKYEDYPTSSVTDPVGPDTGVHRVKRGGSLDLIAGSCRSAYRNSYSPEGRDFIFGFRVALAPVK
ncbi:MAG: formylglycine-generating enzyme family protein, partial [Verrucomicrobia bacterium]|nr:formylglycine-generating enzyme family protein [Verrucomicrobiota bacterium]